MLNVTARHELMSKIVDTLFVVVEDADLTFQKLVLGSDPSHVAMIQMDIDAAD